MRVLTCLSVEEGTCCICGDAFDGYGLVAHHRTDGWCSHEGCDMPAQHLVYGEGVFCPRHFEAMKLPEVLVVDMHNVIQRIGWPVCGDACLDHLEARLLLEGRRGTFVAPGASKMA